MYRSSYRKCSVKKPVYKKSEKFHRKTLLLEYLQVFSLEIGETFKNTYIKEHLQITASKYSFSIT